MGVGLCPLHAAAPALLAACKEISFFGGNALIAAGWGKLGSDGRSMIDRLEAAIALAEGN